GVNNVPLADDIALVCHKSGHGCFLLFLVPSITKEQEWVKAPAVSSSKEYLFFYAKSVTMLFTRNHIYTTGPSGLSTAF
ncbi:MAG: hypothetical protein K2P04_09390, partial [Oscillospiraceae bacterium]|nr:hypothetical protein [Oscillospiraceae bacterium]